MRRWLINTSLLVSILLLCFLATGCSNTSNKNDISITKTPSQYFPLSKGSFWEYEGSGMEYASFKRQVLFTRDNLAQISEDNGGTVIARIFQVNNDSIKSIYFKGESYNPVNLLTSNFVSNDDSRILVTPIKVRTTWTDNNSKKEIIAVNAIVETPAGKFEGCLKIKITNQNDIIYQYYKQGIGMVKQEFISGDTKITSTLKKYEIK